jgi:putative resolvase
MNEKKFVSIGEASILTGLDPQTIRKFADSNQIKCYKTFSGQRRFDKAYLEQMYNPTSLIQKEAEPKKINFIYARVSSKKQLEDLTRQIDYIKGKRSEYSTYTIISDIGSGLNYKKTGLQTILDASLQRTIGEVVIAHRDRLCRFGFNLIQNIIEKCGGKIIVLDEDREKSTEQELSEDLLSIVHIFCCKQMGKRKYGKNSGNKINSNTIVPN